MWLPRWLKSTIHSTNSYSALTAPEAGTGDTASVIPTFLKLTHIFIWLHHAAYMILVLQLGNKPTPLQWKHGVLTTGLPGKFLSFHIDMQNITAYSWGQVHTQQIKSLEMRSRIWKHFSSWKKCDRSLGCRLKLMLGEKRNTWIQFL